ncbi:MAG TPA: apolipoprotein N-acyltransferase [Chitinophagaceae bacterium]|nr:apolipoprotein N-acyltransferase [Chitinophagaceae bacterium]
MIFLQIMLLQKFSNLLLVLFGAFLLWAAWPSSSFTFLIFFSLIPLLYVEDKVSSTRKFFRLTYLHMLLWNLMTTWWIYNASGVGAAMAIILNSLIMCLPWLLMRIIKNRFGSSWGYLSLISFWISFEWLHHTWELSWPWLTLGNSFAMQPSWVQWYEATGTPGGSLWVLLVNIIAYSLLKQYTTAGRTVKYFYLMGTLVAFLVAPILISSWIKKREAAAIRESEVASNKNVVVVQPNIDPYNEKFTAGTQQNQIQKLISLSESKLDTNTALVIWPETAIAVGVWEDQIAENVYYQPIWNFLKRHPQVALLSGMDSYKSYGPDKRNATATARFNEQENFYYDAFNASAMMRADKSAQMYHKAKLVPGVETLPSFLLWMGSLFDDLGGTSGTLGRDKERVALPDAQNYYVAAPVICYESIYSDYITDYIRKGANLLTIMTNDGWWGNTEGHRQHMNYATLRAIETRRWIARSANTGISCFIDPVGQIYQPLPWDIEGAIKMSIEPRQQKTFFVQHGDYLSYIFNGFSIILLVITLTIMAKQRFKADKRSINANGSNN